MIEKTGIRLPALLSLILNSSGNVVIIGGTLKWFIGAAKLAIKIEKSTIQLRITNDELRMNP